MVEHEQNRGDFFYFNTQNDVDLVGFGNDYRVVNGGYNCRIYCSDNGHDVYVDDKASPTTIYGGAGDDILRNGGENGYIYGGAGNDSLYSDGKYLQVFCGEGNDTVSHAGSYSTINGEMGSNKIYSWATSSHNIIQGGYNYDDISNDGNYNSIFGGAGDDYMSNDSNGSDNYFDGEDGNDYLWINNGQRLTLVGGIGNDTVAVFGRASEIYIDGGAGNDDIYNGANFATIYGGKGNDIIQLDENATSVEINYAAGDGNDTIEGYSENATIKITGDKYLALKSGNDLKLIVGTGSILLKDAANIAANIEGTLNSDVSSGGISVKNSVLVASNKFLGSKIDLADYEGVKDVNASAVIYNISIVGGSENDSLRGGKGADTISGGSGENTLTGGSGADVFLYSGGNDFISDYKSGEDKIKLNPSAITSSTVNGSAVVLTTAEGTVSIKSAKDKVITFLDDAGNTTEKIFFADISYAPLANGLTYNSTRTLLKVSNEFFWEVAYDPDGVKIDLNDYLPTVQKLDLSSLYEGVNVTGNANNNSIKGSREADTISGGSGNDKIFGGDGEDELYGGEGNDLLNGGGGDDSLYGGAGNNTLTGGTGDDTFVHEGGNDIITDYFTGWNTIKLSTGKITGSTLKNSDVIINTSGGSITVKNGKGKRITVMDGDDNYYEEYFGLINYNEDRTAITLASAFNMSLMPYDYAYTVEKIDASAVSKSVNIVGNDNDNVIIGGNRAETIYGGSGNDSILGNAGNDRLYGEDGDDTLIGGKGNDTLYGDSGNDVFVYSSGDGNDVIADFSAWEDSIVIADGTIASASLRNSDMVFKIGSGTLTVKDAQGQEITIGDTIYRDNLVYNAEGTSVTLGAAFSGTLQSWDYADNALTIDARKVTKTAYIIGNSQDNTIIGGNKAETIEGGDGDDSIVGNAGNDELHGDEGDDVLLGGNGNDTLYGGSGNDTLTGGAGKDVFAYEGGNDTITDYTAGKDTIKIVSGSITKTAYADNDVVFTVGEGSITVRNGKGKKISITDSNDKTTTLTYSQGVSYAAETSSNGRWFTADDNNFMTDDFQLSSITNLSDANYSVGKNVTFSDTSEFDITDSITAYNSFDKD